MGPGGGGRGGLGNTAFSESNCHQKQVVSYRVIISRSLNFKKTDTRICDIGDSGLDNELAL